MQIIKQKKGVANLDIISLIIKFCSCLFYKEHIFSPSTGQQYKI